MTDVPPSGRFDGREHRLPVRVYYEDTDFTGLVYHASYVRFFERGRSDFLRLAGADHQAMAALDCAFVVLRLEVDFRRPARIDDALVVETAFAGASSIRFDVRQRIVRDKEPLVTARVVVACIDLKGRPRRPPPALIAALGDKLATPSEQSGSPAR